MPDPARHPESYAQFKALNALVDHWQNHLTSTELRTLLTLVRHADREGIAFPSPELIARKIGCTRRNVERAIQGLSGKGLIETVVRGGGRGRVARRQILIVGKTPPQCADVSNTQTPAQRSMRTPAQRDGNPGVGEHELRRTAPNRTTNINSENSPDTHQGNRCVDSVAECAREFLIDCGLPVDQAESRAQQIARGLTLEYMQRLVKLMKLKIERGEADNPVALFVYLARTGANFSLLSRYEEQVRITGVDNGRLINPNAFQQRIRLAAL